VQPVSSRFCDQNAQFMLWPYAKDSSPDWLGALLQCSVTHRFLLLESSFWQRFCAISHPMPYQRHPAGHVKAKQRRHFFEALQHPLRPAQTALHLARFSGLHLREPQHCPGQPLPKVLTQ